jgi:hypothetical protein
MMSILQSQVVTVIIGLVGFAVFLGLAAYSFYRGNRSERRYVPGLLVISLAGLNILIRGLFFPHLSPNPARAGGLFRLANGLLALVGGIMLERVRRQQRDQPR